MTTPAVKIKPGLLPDNVTNGGVTNGGFSITAPAAPQKKTVITETTYVSLSDFRQWTSTDGKALVGRLLAFEQNTVTVTSATTSDAKPVLPAQITVVRDGKVRLLVQTKAYELPLERLCEADRVLIEKIRSAIASQNKEELEKKP